MILGAAEAVIGEDGLHAARMEKIAARAGVSVGTVYNHFEDRAALLHALRESRAGLLRDLLRDALAAARDRPVLDQVRALLDTMVVHARAHGRFFAALMAEHQGPSQLRPPALARAELARHAREIVERGIASGELREDPHQIFAEALGALARLVLARNVEGLSGDAEIAALAELFVRGAGR